MEWIFLLAGVAFLIFAAWMNNDNNRGGGGSAVVCG